MASTNPANFRTTAILKSYSIIMGRNSEIDDRDPPIPGTLGQVLSIVKYCQSTVTDKPLDFYFSFKCF
jgi:hypothetical protein